MEKGLVNSKKQIIKSSAIVGGASLLTILIGLVKTKVLAVLLGPSGIGFMGILITIMGTGATLFGMGLGTSGVRELALNNEDVDKLSIVRKALFSANFMLGVLAVIVMYIFRNEFSEWFLQSANYNYVIPVIAVGVFFSLISGSQTALLQGLRKISELAKVKVFGAFAATFIGLLIIWRFGEFGIPFFVIAAPLSTCIVALYYNRKLPKLTSSSTHINQLAPQWRNMFTLGFAFMLTGLMGTGSQLIVRYILNQELGIESVGYFQSAWQISMTYITFVLGAMAADYYPRLTQVIHDKDTSNRLVNEQTEIAIIFAAPILLAMLAFAPFAINVLYSSEFSNSVEILRWQVLGDTLKVISWPIGFIILAKGYSKLFFIAEFIWNASYVLFVYFGVEYFEIEITGYAFAASYLIQIIFVYFTSIAINGFQWQLKNVKLLLYLTVTASILLGVSYLSETSVIIFGTIITIGSSIYTMKTLSEIGIENPKMKKIFNLYIRCRDAISLRA
ncbi:O-antigen translocase [Vibrio sp. 1863]|uniref:O-antigen translocase n=1 Tax=Vibrio sp. 1863 TaxID=3074579 RepID=UPI002964C068|nr:O-antigen translocase [Vibrio sp. 1863]MDW2075375.1 O-antigen translocase [Vibrio sp. 1863]